jgi:hypothetical protein
MDSSFRLSFFQGVRKNFPIGERKGKNEWTFNPSYFAVVCQSQMIIPIRNMLKTSSDLVMSHRSRSQDCEGSSRNSSREEKNFVPAI